MRRGFAGTNKQRVAGRHDHVVQVGEAGTTAETTRAWFNSPAYSLVTAHEGDTGTLVESRRSNRRWRSCWALKFKELLGRLRSYGTGEVPFGTSPVRLTVHAEF